MILTTLFVAASFAAVHLFAGKLRFLNRLPRSRWLSAAGGVSVAYVFLHLLPELNERQAELGDSEIFFERHVFSVALLGLAAFYGLERLVTSSRKRADNSPGKDNARENVSSEATGRGAFWLSIISFALYNLIIGYLLLDAEAHDAQELLWYAVALGLHFVVNDYGLREDHKERYHREGRYVLGASVLLGWLLGWQVHIPELYVTELLAFLGGGVMLNVLKEELPEERESSFWAFALGVIGYSALLLLT